MKKLYVLLLIIITGTTFGYAQNYYQFKGGISLSQTKLTSDQEMNLDALTSMHGGISFRLPYSKYFYIQPELIFIRKGYTAKNETFDYKINSKPFYVQLPFLFGAYPISGENFKLFLHTGVQISIGVGGEINEIRNNEEITHKIKYGYTPLENDYDPYDFGIVTGFGIELKKMNIGVSYDLGIKEIAAGNNPDLKMYSRCLNFYLGYIIAE